MQPTVAESITNSYLRYCVYAFYFGRFFSLCYFLFFFRHSGVSVASALASSAHIRGAHNLTHTKYCSFPLGRLPLWLHYSCCCVAIVSCLRVFLAGVFFSHNYRPWSTWFFLRTYGSSRIAAHSNTLALTLPPTSTALPETLPWSTNKSDFK